MEHDKLSAARTGSAAVAAIGIDHARLSYAYLNNGDIDSYVSLFEPDAVVRSPEAEPIRGRAALEVARTADAPGTRARYLTQSVFASGNRVAVTGRLTRAVAAFGYQDVEFADIFTVGESGLFVEQSRYFFVSANAASPSPQ
ncbi:nuclear transport factor 2 family protein [Hamadaea tsunoensis]|uniref:nuclear transport factor 2 family protein n=1 Tax=Hamadaea tsunoensis TaxID=53368 RepID=UPI0003F6A288|nr:nuclear transport factor 2 family protein [Hamadaea tsunoensis]